MEQFLNSDDCVDAGEELHRAGRLEEAESHYRKALEMDPGHPGALYYLANIAYDDGRLPLATQLLDELLAEEPKDAEAWYLLGMIALKEEKLNRAIECLGNALNIQPAYWLAHYGMGQALSRQGEVDAALESFQKVLEINPRFADAYHMKGDLLRAEHRLDEAISNYRQALECGPQNEWTLNNLGIALLDKSQEDDARACFERAISCNPDFASAYRNLGNLMINRGKINQGIEFLRKSVTLDPENRGQRLNFAIAIRKVGKLEEAIRLLRDALADDPDDAEAHSVLLGFLQYLPDYRRETLFADHVAFGEHFEAPLRDSWPRFTGRRDSSQRLRVGFVSGNLCSHPVGYFLESVFYELRRRDRMDITVYALNATVDSVTASIRRSSHMWRDVLALSDAALEQRIREDGIDILVDLAGHTTPNRLLVFARKPAPVQVTWLGYWETTGLQAMDYILCDPYCMHEDEAQFYVERPWYLPHTRLCFNPPDVSIGVGDLPAIRTGQITFGCFNNLSKMSDPTVAVWARILKRIPDSRLMLKALPFNDESVCEAVTERFAEHGIDADRLVLQRQSPRMEYFGAYNRVDIALDPFPFPGGTTSVEGLWMGVPMITLRGDRIISRQGESILHNLDMQDWIAADEDDYVELAVRKAGDLAALADLRRELRGRLESSPLCDAGLFAGNLEAALREMWVKYCDSK